MTQEFDELYRAARRGDPGVADAFIERVSDGLHAFLAGYLGAGARRREEPDDVYQATVMTFLRRLPTYPEDLDESQCRAYLFQIAKWQVSTWLRRRPHEKGESAAPVMEPVSPEPTTGPLTKADELQWLRDQISQLPATYSEVLILCAIDGLSIDEAAGQLEISRDGVKKRLTRARKALKERLSSRNDSGDNE